MFAITRKLPRWLHAPKAANSSETLNEESPSFAQSSSTCRPACDTLIERWGQGVIFA